MAKEGEPKAENDATWQTEEAHSDGEACGTGRKRVARLCLLPALFREGCPKCTVRSPSYAGGPRLLRDVAGYARRIQIVSVIGSAVRARLRVIDVPSTSCANLAVIAERQPLPADVTHPAGLVEDLAPPAAACALHVTCSSFAEDTSSRSGQGYTRRRRCSWRRSR